MKVVPVLSGLPRPRGDQHRELAAGAPQSPLPRPVQAVRRARLPPGQAAAAGIHGA